MVNKQQDASSSLSLRSSSYRHENSPKNLQTKSIGCMSGIFHLLIYKYNSRRGKFITSGSGKKQENNNITQQPESCNNNNVMITCDVHRSPTLPAEIRLGNNTKTTTAEICLEEAAGKRRKLIEALEKCDEDLKELKKIIEAVKNSVDQDFNNNNNIINGDLQPSPVSVLDDFTHLSSSLSCSNYPKRYANGRAVQQQKQKQKKKPGEDEEMMIMKMSNISTLVETIIQGKSYMRREKVITAVISPMSMWGSKAMIDSVNEVCKDIAWGERREIGRIGLALQDYICRDLIDEFVKELIGSFCMYSSLPFEACRRSLRF